MSEDVLWVAVMSACSITASCIDRDDRLGRFAGLQLFSCQGRARAVEFLLERLMSARIHLSN